MIWTIVIFLITISLLVTAHEFGHFIVARWCGVRVECFSVGFGKKLWSYTTQKDSDKKGTEFIISAIPLGGYVKMLDGRNTELAQEDKAFAFDYKSVSKRAAIISAGPIANFILAFVIYWIIFQIGVTSYPVRIAQIIPNTPVAEVNIPQGVELKTIAGINIESWADVNSALISELGNHTVDIIYETNDKTQYHQPVNITNWQFDIEKESSISAFGFVPAPVEIYPIISKIQSNSAAEIAGLKVGDEVIGYNNREYDSWHNLSQLIKIAEPIKLMIKRGSQILSVNLMPKLGVDKKGETVGIAGIYPSNNTIIKQYGIVDAFAKGVERTVLTLKLVVRSFYQLITGTISIKNLSGPITIAKSAGQTADYGMMPYLFFLAFISVSLGVVNLVPLPMLDGGHLIFLLAEKIKGSPLSLAKQELFYRFGFILLMTLMGIALFNDFTRLS